METAPISTTDLFAPVGGALFRRAVALLGDEEVAAKVAEELFVRFAVHARGATMDARARWTWIYRVATSYCLRRLPDEAWPGKRVTEPAVSRRGPPDMGALRAFDEATQNIVVLAIVDGLPPDEISQVLGLPVGLVRKRLTDGTGGGSIVEPSPPEEPSSHPSSLALDRDRGMHTLHIADCPRCRAIIDEADRLTERFVREIAPLAHPRVAEAIRLARAEAKGPRWTRALWMGGALVAISALAFVVARPRAPDRAQAPFAGSRGALRAKASGIQITVRRGEEVRALAPDARLRVGDRLHFRVRAERPRYLELRVRGPGGDVRVFPGAGGEALLVRPGQALDRDYVVGGISPPVEVRGQKLWIIGLFADGPFHLDRPPGPDTEVVPVRVDTEI